MARAGGPSPSKWHNAPLFLLPVLIRACTALRACARAGPAPRCGRAPVPWTLVCAHTRRPGPGEVKRDETHALAPACARTASAHRA